MSQKTFYSTAGTIFLVVAVVHFLRILNDWEVNIDTFSIPVWGSWLAVFLAGWLAYQGLKKKSN